MCRPSLLAAVAMAISFAALTANAGPETAMREVANGAIQNGVRTTGMGGDGGTTGNTALVYQDAGEAHFDVGVVRYSDTANVLAFTAVGFTTPTFWDDAALYVAALSQRATDLRVWDYTAPTPFEPPSLADGSSQSALVKFAKPLSRTLSIGLMAHYQQSQMTLLPLSGTPPIRYETSWLPSGGVGLHWHPDGRWQVGGRAILANDWETRDDASGLRSGLVRAYEYRLGAAWSPWRGMLIDVGGVAFDRSSRIEARLGLPGASFKIFPTIGIEQALVAGHVWAHAGLDAKTGTAGMILRATPFRLDLAYLYGIAMAPIGDQFGQRNASVIAMFGLDYESLLTRD